MFSLVVCLEKGKIGTWKQMKQMSNDMNRRGQKEHSKQNDKQNKFTLITKHALIHLKCGSTLLVK